MPLTRRELVRSTALATLFPALETLTGMRDWAAAKPASDGGGSQQAFRHGSSLFGDLKYPADFKQFDYVNAEAPKGGVVRQAALGMFDNFNIVCSGVKGALAAGIEYLYDPLLTPALDEMSAAYGLIAESVSYPEDYTSVTFRLRPEARWHDGKPISVQDVIFTFEALRKHHPQLAAYFRNVVSATQTGEHEVRFDCDQPGNRELPQMVGQLRVLPKHWWEGLDSKGNKRDVADTSLEVPLAGGPYRLKGFHAGRSVSYGRVPDYWGKDLPVNVGRNNFDEIRFEYFRDITVAMEAFKANQLDWRTERSAKSWAKAYDFEAVQDKQVVLEEFPIRNAGIMQGFAFNTRRDKFNDARVRQAFNYAFDFEEMNAQLFYGQYKRIQSYFERTELACFGVPTGLELEILETVRGQVPPELFTKPYKNPVNGNAEAVRRNLHKATALLREAGYEVKDQKLLNVKSGEPFTVELLAPEPNTARFMLFYQPSLERLGMTVTVRTVDRAQFQNRLRQWDFDIITGVWPQTLSPGNEQRVYWGSQAADQPGSRNLIGIKNPAVDALIERVVLAKSRSEFVAATRALDRVLLWNHYVVPQWTLDKVRSARWDRFGRPDTMPEYGMATFPSIWWWDDAKAAKLADRR